MPKPQTLNAPRSVFSKRHYVWLAKAAQPWPKSIHVSLAYELWNENTHFKPVRWFQAVGYDRAAAEALHEVVMRMFDVNGINMRSKDNA